MEDFMKNLKYVFFIIIFLLLFITLNYYIGKRTFSRLSDIHKINNKIFWALFWFTAFSYIIYGLLNRYFPKYLSNPIMYIGIYYMAMALYLLMLFAITDVFLIINKKFNFFPNIKDKSLLFTLIFFVLIIGLIAMGSFNANNSYIKKYDIKIDKALKEEKLNIVLISDIHLGDILGNARLKKMVNEINRLNPDLVLIAGDLIDSSMKPFIENNMALELGKIKSKYGTFFALGNHDLFDNKVEALCSLLQNQGVTVLRDDYKLIDNSFYIVGRDDVSARRINAATKELKAITKDIDSTKPIILIDHTPSRINESAEANIDLQVSGHTHKGQLFPFNLITKGIFEDHYGYMKKNNFNIVVSSGYGTWGPPLRIGSRSEIVNITLEKGTP